MGKSSDRLSVFVSGDICPSYKIAPMLANGQGNEVFGDTAAEIRDCDVSILSLEAPLTSHKKQIIKCGPALKAPQSVARSFVQVGYNVACLANNHILDYGAKGLTDTTRSLDANGIKWFGVGKDQADATKPLMITRKGMRLAFIGLAETEFSCAEDGWGAGRIKPLKNCDLISDVAKKVDVLIVFVHGGNEYCPFPSPRMIELYRAYVRAGAGVVVGSHAHVPQGYEIYQNRPIFYSLGNFIFPWPTQPSVLLWERGFAVKLYFAKKKFSGFDIIPTIMDRDSGKVNLMDAEEKGKFMAYLKQLCKIITTPKRHDQLWNAWCAMRVPSWWLANMKDAIWPVKTTEQRMRLARFENMIRCEAHHEVGSTFLRLARTRKLTEAKKTIPLVKSLMKAYL